jgi:hypothetical protein
MTNIALRKKLHSCVDEMDERYLKAIYSYLKDFSSSDYEIGNDEKALLDSRREAYKSGKVKGLSLAEVKRKIRGKSGK